MEDPLTPRLAGLRPALQRGWKAELRRVPAGPPGTGLVIPEMLVLMVDQSIDRLLAGRDWPADRSQPVRRLTRFPAAGAGCQCGLHLLLTYYLSGVRALRAVLPADLGPARRKIIREFIRAARSEMDALCGICRHRGGSFCQLRPSAAASRATPSATRPSRGERPG